MQNNNYLKPVNSTETAKSFLVSLHENGLSFHPEESAYECLSCYDLGAMALNTINQNMGAALVYLPDACQTVLDIMQEGV